MEKRKEPADPSQDHMLNVGSDTGHQSERMKLSDEGSVVAGLHVCAAGVSMPDGFEDTDKLGRPGHSTYCPMTSRCTDTCPEEPLPTDQVKEAREKNVRLMTEHDMFDIVPESDVREKTVRAAWLDDFGKLA